MTNDASTGDASTGAAAGYPSTLNKFRLDGKTALVVGIGPAIGAHVARAFAEAGANVVVSARNTTAVEELAQELGADYGGKAAGFAGDAANAGDLDHVLAATRSYFGAIDVVFYNAFAIDSGHGRTFEFASLLEVSDEDWEACCRVNLIAPFRLARAVVPQMKANGGGVIINNLAAAAFTPILPAVAYASTKSALGTMTKYLAKECGPEVRCNCIAVSNIESPKRSKAMRDAAATFPMGRLGRPDEVAGAALFLASEASSFMTGQVLFVDGGRVTTR